MKKVTTTFLLFVALMLSLNDIVKADVYPFYIRVTQPTNETPFDGSFTDGTAAAIRFYTPFSTVTFSATVKIYSGNIVVKTITKNDLSGTDNFVLWDGSNDANTAAANGDYTVEITTTQNSAATAYTVHDAGDVAVGLSTRGVTVVNNPRSRNNGFAYGINNGGGANPWGFVGLGRVAMTGQLFGHVADSAYVPTTGSVALGGSNRRYSPTYAPDGYIYSVAFTEKKIMRLHPDSLVNEFFTPDTVPTTGTLLDVEIVGEGAGKGMLIASTTQILFAAIGEGSTFSGSYDTLLSAEAGMTLYAVQAGGHQDQKHLFVVVRSALTNVMDAVYKFDYSAGLTRKTFADSVWGAHFVDGDAVSITFKAGNTPAGDILYLTLDKAGAGTFVSGIYALTDLDAANPTVNLVFADPDNNTTSSRGEVGVDYGGNLIYFENSNEQIFVLEPPTSNLASTITGPDAFAVTSSGVVTPPITIAESKVDANADGKPDKLNQVVTIIGTVNSVNTQTTGTQYTVQDVTGGIALYKGGTIVPFNVGDVLQITGAVAFYNGLAEITPTDITTGVMKLDSNKTIDPVVLTIGEYLVNGEKYESMLIQLNGVTKASDSPAWPAPGANVNLNIWDGKDKLVLRIDKDTQIDDSVEVSWPVNVKGIASQFSSATPYADGYQIIPSFYADFTPNVPVAPLPYFHLATPANDAVVEITDSNATLKMTWNKAVDFNNDVLIYQFVLLNPVKTSGVLNDTVYSYTGTQALGWMGTADTLHTKWTVKTKGKEAALVSSVDTFNITFVRKITVGINDNVVPVDFYVNQNYPNPFNPSTTISFGLPKESFVDLRVYNVLGQEVAVLISNQIRKAGNQQVKFDGAALASGTYIYRLKTDNQVVTKKMILMK